VIGAMVKLSSELEVTFAISELIRNHETSPALASLSSV
jgi:hypothetical protein